MRRVSHAARIGHMRNAYKILVTTSEGERQFRRPRRRWEDNIRMDIGGNMVGRCGMDACGFSKVITLHVTWKSV
jgi:hypothetical protein